MANSTAAGLFYIDSTGTVTSGKAILNTVTWSGGTGVLLLSDSAGNSLLKLTWAAGIGISVTMNGYIANGLVVTTLGGGEVTIT